MHALFKVALPVLVIVAALTVGVVVAVTLPVNPNRQGTTTQHSHRPTYSGAVPWSHVYFPQVDFDGTTWSDQSGNGNDVTAANGPVSIAGTLVLTSAQTLTWPAGSIPTDYTILVRMKLATGAAAHLLEGLTGAAAWTLSHDGAGTVTHSYDGTDTALVTDGAEWQVVAFKNEPPVISGFTSLTLDATVLATSFKATGDVASYSTVDITYYGVASTDGNVFVVTEGDYWNGGRKSGCQIYFKVDGSWVVQNIVEDQASAGRCMLWGCITPNGQRVFYRDGTKITEAYLNGSSYSVRTYADATGSYMPAIDCNGDNTNTLLTYLNWLSDTNTPIYLVKITSAGVMSTVPFNAGTNTYTITQGGTPRHSPTLSRTGATQKLCYLGVNAASTCRMWRDNGTTSWDFVEETLPVTIGEQTWRWNGDLTVLAIGGWGSGTSVAMYAFDFDATAGSRFTLLRTVNLGFTIGPRVAMSDDGLTIATISGSGNGISSGTCLIASAANSWTPVTTPITFAGTNQQVTIAAISGDASRAFFGSVQNSTTTNTPRIQWADAPTATATSLYAKNSSLQSLTQTIPAASGNNAFQLTVNAGTSSTPAAVELKEVRIYDSHLSGAAITTLVDEMLAMLDPPHTVTYATLVGFVGSAIANLTPSAQGGAASSIASSALAALGLSVDNSTGTVSGTPSVSAAAALDVTWTNEAGAYTASVQTQIYAVPSFTVASVAVMTTDGVLSNITPTLAPAADDYVSWSNFAVASGTLPDGITLDPDTGVLSGTLTDVANFSPVDLTISAELTVYGTVTTNTLTLRLPDPEAAPTTSGTDTDTATVVDVAALEYERTLNQVVVGGTLTIRPTLDFANSGTTFSISQNTLPEEFTIDAATGIISGTARQVRPPRYHVVVGIQGAKRVEVTLIIRVDYGIDYTVAYGNVQQRADGVWLFPVDEAIALGPDLGALTAASFELAGGTLPTGVTFDAETGQLTGTPTRDAETGVVQIDIATSPTNDSAYARSELTYLVTRDVPAAAAATTETTDVDWDAVYYMAAGGFLVIGAVILGVVTRKDEHKRRWWVGAVVLGLVGAVLVIVGAVVVKPTKTTTQTALPGRKSMVALPSRAARAKLTSNKRTLSPRVCAEKYKVRSGQPVTLKVTEPGRGLPYGLTVDDTGTVSGVCRARCTKSSTYVVSAVRDHVQTFVYFDLEVGA